MAMFCCPWGILHIILGVTPLSNQGVPLQGDPVAVAGGQLNMAAAQEVSKAGWAVLSTYNATVSSPALETPVDSNVTGG